MNNQFSLNHQNTYLNQKPSEGEGRKMPKQHDSSQEATPPKGNVAQVQNKTNKPDKSRY